MKSLMKSLRNNFIDYLIILTITLVVLTPVYLMHYQDNVSKREQKELNNVEILRYYGDPGQGVHHLRMDGHDCFTYSRTINSTAISCTRIPSK